MAHILVVDDNSNNRYYLETLLTARSDQITLARHGAEALTLARQSPPDLIVSDLLMPVMDGYTLLRHWKSDPRLRQVPFVVYTATYTEPADQRLALSLGADAFIVKPMEPDEFVARLAAVLSKAREAAEPVHMPTGDEAALSTQYSEVLFRKLEKKVAELEQSCLALQKESAERGVERRYAETIALLLNTYEEHASGWLWQADAAGHLLGSPPRMERLLGVPQGALAGRPIWAPWLAGQPDDLPVAGEGWTALHAAITDGQPFRERIVEARRDGAAVWLSLSGRRSESGGWLGVGTDVTDRECALRELAAARDAALAGLKAKSQFVATMSHELRTPLNAVIGFSELLLSAYAGPLSERQASYVGHIHESGVLLLSLVNNVLDLAKIESKRIGLEETEFDLAEAITEVLHLVEIPATRADVSFQIDYPPQLPPIRADRLRIKQVLINLIGNAIKFSRPGGIVRVVAEPRPDGTLAMAVTDTGIGMSARDIPRALEPFGQLDDRPARHYQGTGLGLPLAKHLAELHGARFDIDSEIDRGTTVTIVFPAHRVPVSGPNPG